MTSEDYSDVDSVKAFSSQHRASMREDTQQFKFKQHPYRFVSYLVFASLVIFQGMFMTAYTPINDAMIRVF